MTATSRQYGWITPEIRGKAVEAVVRALEQGHSLTAACELIAQRLEVHRNSVMNWVRSSAEYGELQRRHAGELARRLAEVEALDVLTEGLRSLLQAAADERED